jgi:RND superfamily putative drug exporter
MNKFEKIYKSKFFRILAPLAIIVIWFAVAGVGGPIFGKISNVSKNDQASFLPASAESTKAQTIQQKFYGTDTIPAIVIVESQTARQPKELGSLTSLATKLKDVSGVASTSAAITGPIPSKDGKAVEFIVQVSSTSKIQSVVQDMRAVIKSNIDSSYKSYVTGPAGLTGDLVLAFGGIDGILLLVAVIAVFVILLLVYRSIILPFVVLITAMFALTGAILVVYQLALHNVISLNGQSQGILSILVIGAATDYSLLFIARYKEALRREQSKWRAILQTYKGAFTPIAASAATVVVALLCLLFSDLNSNKSLGPIAAVGIVMAFVAVLTILPAVLVSFGRKAFWPLTPHYDKTVTAETTVKPTSLWGRVGKLVSLHPRRVWIICAVALLAGVVGLSQLKASGTTQADTLLSASNAVDGQAVVARHFSAGSGSPVAVIVNTVDATKTINLLNEEKGVSQAAAYIGGSPYAQVPPKEVNGQILINATLSDAVDSQAAQNTVIAIRDTLKEHSITGLVGGESAIMLDTNVTALNDLFKIVPIVLIVILIILMFLLRSILSAVILIGTVILSYFATLGISALVFNGIFHFAGADPSVPLFGFIFLVALGVDYNIFLMTRVREEARHTTTRKAIIHALQVTGGVITSAGVVLAATFAALGVIPILFLAQIAFIVSFGVLLDTIIVRSLLLSSLIYDLDSKIWWPSKRFKKP